jgi:inositol oxygenase
MKILVDEPHLIDPSELLRPEPDFADKCLTQFRDYSIDESNPLKEMVRKTYRLMHLNQTVDYVKDRHREWLKFDHVKLTVREALELLNQIVDESDPDLDLPNIIHAFQTAERARKEFPQYDWLHLTGLIHDLGKIMAFYGEPQYSVVGDTYPVGCLWSDNIVYRDESFEGNVDALNPKYNTKYGIYKPKCGITNLMMSWGHDEYLYRVLKHNKCTLPQEALNIIRFHSFYPWHTSGDYQYFECPEDLTIKKWVLVFNRYDLYTKSAKTPDLEELWPYYQSLIDKYIPDVLEW